MVVVGAPGPAPGTVEVIAGAMLSIVPRIAEVVMSVHVEVLEVPLPWIITIPLLLLAILADCTNLIP